MSRLLQDFRYALRTCLGARLVSGLAVLAFALGIAVTTTVFTIFYSVLLKPLPFPEPERLVRVYDTQPACATCPASFPDYHDWRTRNTVFAAIGGTFEANFVLTGGPEPLQVPAVRATASLADVFGLQPMLGRWIREGEDRPGGPKVAVLTHALWTAQFARDPAVIGKAIVLDDERYEVVGVMPPSFTLGDARSREPLLYVPLGLAFDPSTRGSHLLLTYARLKAGVSVQHAAAEMRAIGTRLAQEFGGNHGVDVQSYREAMVGTVRPQLRLLLGAVGIVLLIGCANVANLLLAAGLGRRRELGIRLALGARIGDLSRQLVAESTILATTGALLGVLLALWLLRAFVALAGSQLPRADGIAVDGRVLLFTSVVTLSVGIFCGLWPLVRLRSRDLATAVREGDTRTATAGGGVSNGLVVAEIALAFALLVGGGLLTKNLFLLENRDPGLQTERVVTFDLEPSGQRYTKASAARALYRELFARVSQIDGVQKIGSASHLPMRRFGWNSEVQTDGRVPWEPRDAPLVQHRWFYGDYFQAVGVPLIEGRWLDARDGAGTNTVLINRAMADKFWPGENAIGRRFGVGADRTRWWEVVGIVENVRSAGLSQSVPFEFYRTLDQQMFRSQTVVIRTTSGDPSSIVPTVKELVRAIDPALPVTAVKTMREVVVASVGGQRLVSAMAAVFALLAALLAMVGVFGVMTYNVRRQRRELGIRLALGADAADVRQLIVRRGITLAALGSAVGALAAYLVTGTLQSMLDDVAPRDPEVLLGTTILVLTTAMLASWPPARSAARTDPMIVLRDN